MRPLAKTVPWLRQGDDIVVAVNPTAEDLRRLPDPERAVERVLRDADGSRTPVELAAVTGLDDAGLADVLGRLDTAGLLVDADEPAALSAAERARWRNNLGFFEAYADVEHGPAGFHRRLREARVLLLGAGGLGSMMLMNLAGLGVGEVVVVDFDVVDAPNFTRQFTYREADLGRVKVERAGAWVRDFTGHTEVITLARRISSAADVADLLDGVDVVVCAIDQPAEAPQWVNEACHRAGVPSVYGGFFFTKGRYESVWPGHSPCLACLLLGEVFELQPINRATGPSVSVVGGLMALEVARYLSGYAPPAAAGRSWIVDFRTGAVSGSVRWGRSPECPVCGDAVDPGAGAEADPAAAPDGPLTPASRVDVRHLTVAPDGDEFLVGDLAQGVFVAVPAVGAAVIESLRRGATVAEAATDAAAMVGTDVDVLGFVGVLRDRGLVRGGAPADAAGVAAGEAETAPAARSWRTRAVGALASVLLSPPMWVLYLAALLAGLGILLVEPGLRPSWEAVVFLPDPALALLVNVLTVLALTAVHEGFHWLAARRLDLPAPLRVSRRGLFVVFETDLTRLWAVPRSRRYAAFLIGMAFDGLVLGGCLVVRLAHQRGWITLPETVDRYLAVVVLAAVIALIGQTPLFMRTDLYAVLVTALRCHNLYRASMLIVRGRLVGLTPAERAELAAASDRDRRVGRWFGALYLFGVIGLAYLLFGLFVPAAFSFIVWSVQNVLSTAVTSAVFWEAAAVALFLTAELLWPPLHWLVGRIRRRRTGAPPPHRAEAATPAMEGA